MRERVGFIGLGNMGKPMAANLLAAGFPLSVLDIDPLPVKDLCALGANRAETGRQLAEGSDIICSVLMNDRQTREVMFDPDSGVLAGAQAGSLIILHSTLSIDMCRELAQAAATQQVGVIDAAVSGAAERSREGTLSLMVGGEAALVRRARPLLDVVGKHVYHMGEIGMGQAAKICNNHMTLLNVHVIEEALRVARSLGIDEDVMRKVAEASSADSWALRNIDNMRELAAIHTKGEVDMGIFGRKDISLASKLAAGANTPAPIVDFVFDLTKRG